MSGPDVVTAVLQWHVTHVSRQLIGAVKNRIDNELKASDVEIFSPLYTLQNDVSTQLT